MRYRIKRSFISLDLAPGSTSTLLAKLPCRDNAPVLLIVPALPLRCVLMATRSRDGLVGGGAVVLKVEVDVEAVERPVLVRLNRRCVVSWTADSESEHHGQVSLRVSQPSSRSFSGQLERSWVDLQARTSSYHRWLQGCVETLRPATHMMQVLRCDAMRWWMKISVARREHFDSRRLLVYGDATDACRLRNVFARRRCCHPPCSDARGVLSNGVGLITEVVIA